MDESGEIAQVSGPPEEQVSKVVYVKNVDSRTSYREILDTFRKFGEVDKIKIVKRSRIALLEFCNIKSAIACYEYYY